MTKATFSQAYQILNLIQQAEAENAQLQGVISNAAILQEIVLGGEYLKEQGVLQVKNLRVKLTQLILESFKKKMEAEINTFLQPSGIQTECGPIPFSMKQIHSFKRYVEAEIGYQDNVLWWIPDGLTLQKHLEKIVSMQYSGIIDFISNPHHNSYIEDDIRNTFTKGQWILWSPVNWSKPEMLVVEAEAIFSELRKLKFKLELGSVTEQIFLHAFSSIKMDKTYLYNKMRVCTSNEYSGCHAYITRNGAGNNFKISLCEDYTEPGRLIYHKKFAVMSIARPYFSD